MCSRLIGQLNERTPETTWPERPGPGPSPSTDSHPAPPAAALIGRGPPTQCIPLHRSAGSIVRPVIAASCLPLPTPAPSPAERRRGLLCIPADRRVTSPASRDGQEGGQGPGWGRPGGCGLVQRLAWGGASKGAFGGWGNDKGSFHERKKEEWGLILKKGLQGSRPQAAKCLRGDFRDEETDGWVGLPLPALVLQSSFL